ncbi:MAG: pilus assembly protein PilX [Proteobacteria bacterium]|nr:pilus assembly protein PilX [Pseudomonadota bacterium]
MSPLQHRAANSGQRGMALVTALLLLVVVTIIALGMFRSFGLQEKIAGNTREKNRAFNAAVSAQQFAENWLAGQATPPAGVVCVAGPVPSANTQACSNTPDNGFAAPWTLGGADSGTVYDVMAPAGQVINGNAPSAGTWAKQPYFWITALGPPVGNITYYQVDAVGWGGTVNSVAVVESVYQVTTSGANSLDK